MNSKHKMALQTIKIGRRKQKQEWHTKKTAPFCRQLILISHKNFHFHDDLMWLIDSYGKWNAEMDANKFICVDTVSAIAHARSFVRSFCFASFILFVALFVRFSSFACGLVLFYFGVVLIGDFVNIRITANIHSE